MGSINLRRCQLLAVWRDGYSFARRGTEPAGVLTDTRADTIYAHTYFVVHP